MNKEDFIKRHGKVAYDEHLGQNRKWQEENPERKKASDLKKSRKGGNRYERTLKYNRTGKQGARSVIRAAHRRQWRAYKQIIAPESQIHHEWKRDSAEYTGVALVEKNQHMHGFVDVIEILDGKITLLTEAEIRKGKKKQNDKKID